MDSDTTTSVISAGELRDKGNALSGILSKLKHLDLTGRVLDKDAAMDAHGGYCDIFVGFVPSENLRHRRTICTNGGRVKVAVKRLRVRLKKDISLAKSIAREMSIWSRLDHPNILPLLGYMFERDYPSLISEWIDNGTVRDFLQKNPSCDVIHLALGIAKGLKYIHDQDIVHSDMKADNVLLGRDGEPLICDFGISRMLDSSQSYFVSTTHDHNIKGSTRWMAIELLESGESKHSKETDVWAYGMTLYEIITRQLPFAHLKNDVLVMFAIVKGELPHFPSLPISTALSNDQHRWISSICLDCWTRAPLNRPTISQTTIRLSGLSNEQDRLQRDSLTRAVTHPLSPSRSENALVSQDSSRLHGFPGALYPTEGFLRTQNSHGRSSSSLLPPDRVISRSRGGSDDSAMSASKPAVGTRGRYENIPPIRQLRRTRAHRSLPNSSQSVTDPVAKAKGQPVAPSPEYHARAGSPRRGTILPPVVQQSADHRGSTRRGEMSPRRRMYDTSPRREGAVIPDMAAFTPMSSNRNSRYTSGDSSVSEPVIPDVGLIMEAELSRNKGDRIRRRLVPLQSSSEEGGSRYASDFDCSDLSSDDDDDDPQQNAYYKLPYRTRDGYGSGYASEAGSRAPSRAPSRSPSREMSKRRSSEYNASIKPRTSRIFEIVRDPMDAAESTQKRLDNLELRKGHIPNARDAPWSSVPNPPSKDENEQENGGGRAGEWKSRKLRVSIWDSSDEEDEYSRAREMLSRAVKVIRATKEPRPAEEYEHRATLITNVDDAVQKLSIADLD